MLTNALLDTHHGVTRYDRATLVADRRRRIGNAIPPSPAPEMAGEHRLRQTVRQQQKSGRTGFHAREDE